jgi:hypothetical protein
MEMIKAKRIFAIVKYDGTVRTDLTSRDVTVRELREANLVIIQLDDGGFLRLKDRYSLYQGDNLTSREAALRRVEEHVQGIKYGKRVPLM